MFLGSLAKVSYKEKKILKTDKTVDCVFVVIPLSHSFAIIVLWFHLSDSLIIYVSFSLSYITSLVA